MSRDRWGYVGIAVPITNLLFLVVCWAWQGELRQLQRASPWLTLFITLSTVAILGLAIGATGFVYWKFAAWFDRAIERARARVLHESKVPGGDLSNREGSRAMFDRDLDG